MRNNWNILSHYCLITEADQDSCLTKIPKNQYDFHEWSISAN